MVERFEDGVGPMFNVETLCIDEEVSVEQIALHGLDKITVNQRPTNPETSEQKVEVSLEARLSFVDRNQQNMVWLNPLAIAKKLDTNDRWVGRMVKELGISPEVGNVVVNGKEITTTVYPPWTLDILREELHWRQYIRDLPRELTIADLSDSLGRSRGWTEKNIEIIGAKPVRKRPHPLYGKSALKELRHISMAVPLDDGWFNLNQLVDFTGADRAWIINRLNEAGHEPVLRRSSLTGRVLDYYAPQAIDSLVVARSERAVPAGDWVTAYAIAQAIDRSQNWVITHVGQFNKMPEPRQDDNGVTRIHYPPEVLQVLQELSDQLTHYPEKGDYLNIHQVARRSGHATPWAEEVLRKLGIEPEVRKDKKDRLHSYYPPEVVNILVEYEKDNPQEKLVTPEELWKARVAVGSLRAKIRLKRKTDKALAQHGVPKSNSDREEIESDICELQKELKPAKQRLYRLENKLTIEFET